MSQSAAPPRLDTIHRQTSLRWWVGTLVAGAVAGWLLWRFNPAFHGFYPRCLLYSTTGILCPGCGVLRASHQLLHGNVREAFALNPLFIAVLPFAGWYAIELWRDQTGREGDVAHQKRHTGEFAWLVRLGVDPDSVPGLRRYAHPMAVLAGAMAGFGIARNLPIASWLAW